MKHKILIIDKDEMFSDFLLINLLKEGFLVNSANSMITAVSFLKNNELPDLMLISNDLPDIQTQTFISQLKNSDLTSATPIIIMLRNEKEIIDFYSQGVDDCIIKPFAFQNLIYKIQDVIERISKYDYEEGIIYKLNGLSLDTSSRKAFVNGHDIQLTNKEYKILLALVIQNGRTLTREELLTKAFGGTKAAAPRLIDIHIASLRHKLGIERGIIETVHGIGYKLSPLADYVRNSPSQTS